MSAANPVGLIVTLYHGPAGSALVLTRQDGGETRLSGPKFVGGERPVESFFLDRAALESIVEEATDGIL